MNEGNRASKEDIDLENAIGDVFGQFDFGSVDKEEGTNHQLQQDQLEEQDKDQPQQPESKLEHYHTDTLFKIYHNPPKGKRLLQNQSKHYNIKIINKLNIHKQTPQKTPSPLRMNWIWKMQLRCPRYGVWS